MLEARGLDVTPAMTVRLSEAGDTAGVKVLQIIYRDEINHVALGCKWFDYFCKRDGLVPEETYKSLVRCHFRGGLKPPFNHSARAAAGFPATYYANISS